MAAVSNAVEYRRVELKSQFGGSSARGKQEHSYRYNFFHRKTPRSIYVRSFYLKLLVYCLGAAGFLAVFLAAGLAAVALVSLALAGLLAAGFLAVSTGGVR